MTTSTCNELHTDYLILLSLLYLFTSSKKIVFLPKHLPTSGSSSLIPFFSGPFAASSTDQPFCRSVEQHNGLNSEYRHYVEYYDHRLKDWSDTLEDANLEMAKVTPKKPAGTVPPNQTNVFAMKTAGGEKPSGAEEGKANGNGGRGKGGRKSYGTRPGNCNQCGVVGHYSYECTAKDSQAGASAPSGKSAN